MYREKKISLSITSCKKWGLLERVLKAFKVFCKDSHVIDKILFYDDSSTDEEKRAMESLLAQLFPDHDRIITHFYPDSFEHRFRHAAILNDMRSKLTTHEIDYMFLLEDDFLFINHFSISEMIDLLINYQEYGQVNLSFSWKNFPEWCKPREIGDYWEMVYFEDKPLLENLFLDEVAAIQTLNGVWYWQTYLNWPHFSLRPGLTCIKKFLSIEDFSTSHDTTITGFELEFAKLWSKKYKSLCSKNVHIINLDQNGSQSSYLSNNSLR